MPNNLYIWAIEGLIALSNTYSSMYGCIERDVYRLKKIWIEDFYKTTARERAGSIVNHDYLQYMSKGTYTWGSTFYNLYFNQVTVYRPADFVKIATTTV
jgi:hypothetical protein